MKKLLAVLLAVTIVMSMGVVAFAADHSTEDTHGTKDAAAVGDPAALTSSGDSQAGRTEFYLNIDKNAVSPDTQISATIPLWVCMYAYGGDGKVVTPASDAYQIVNTGSKANIKVYAIQAFAQNGWSFQSFDSSVFNAGAYVRENNTLSAAKTMAMTVKGEDLSAYTSGLKDLDSDWTVAKNNGTLDLSLQAYIAPGGVNEGNETNVVNVMYYVTAA